MELTQKELELTRHALGLPKPSGTSYRNRYVIGPAHQDYLVWETMVKKGFATRRIFSDHSCICYMFQMTKAGARKALLPGEKLCKEDF